MHSKARYLAVGLLIAAASQASGQSTIAPGTLASLVETERSFARRSVERGMDSAFVAFLAGDAILFRPHPVNGQEWFRTHPSPPIELLWEPGYADLSRTGDLGYTTGPWTARDKADTTDPPSYGEFVTVWKRDGGDGWKVALDMGVSHPKPDADVRFTSPARWGARPVLVRPDSGHQASERGTLFALEQTTWGDSLRPAPVASLRSLLAPRARIFRPGRFPVVGKDSAAAFLASDHGTIVRRRLGGDVALGADMGYTYGSYRYNTAGGRDVQEGYYLTVWKKERGQDWSVVLDLQTVLRK